MIDYDYMTIISVWLTPVKSGLLWGIDKMVAAIHRKITPSN